MIRIILGAMFQRLHQLQAFEQRHFPHLQSRVDSVLVTEVGRHEEQGKPLTAKRLLALNIAPPATVRRRLERLVRLGIIHKRPLSHDRRIYQLAVDLAVRQVYARYLKLLARL